MLSLLEGRRVGGVGQWVVPALQNFWDIFNVPKVNLVHGGP